MSLSFLLRMQMGPCQGRQLSAWPCGGTGNQANLMSSDICVTLGKSLSFSELHPGNGGDNTCLIFNLLASLVAQMLKNLPAMWETQV